jgi:hypothetical protein
MSGEKIEVEETDEANFIGRLGKIGEDCTGGCFKGKIGRGSANELLIDYFGLY